MMTLMRMALLLGLGLAAGSLALASETPATATVLGSSLQTRDPQELQYLIIQPLLDRYAKEKGIEVSPEEIAAYQAEKARFMADDRRKRETRRAELGAQLQGAPPGGEGRDALARELAVLDSLAAMEGLEKDDDTPEVSAYADQVARAFILRHKVNRALYCQYGGRVIFQQAGPEPLDAYRKFLEGQAAQGNFRIFDLTLEKEFWRYFTTDALHQFYPAGSQEEADAFDEILPGSGR